MPTDQNLSEQQQKYFCCVIIQMLSTSLLGSILSQTINHKDHCSNKRERCIRRDDMKHALLELTHLCYQKRPWDANPVQICPWFISNGLTTLKERCTTGHWERIAMNSLTLYPAAQQCLPSSSSLISSSKGCFHRYISTRCKSSAHGSPWWQQLGRIYLVLLPHISYTLVSAQSLVTTRGPI